MADRAMTNEEKAKALKEMFPALGVSYGYIGNLERWGDDRSWYVFTKIREHGDSMSVRLGGPDIDMKDVTEQLRRIEARARKSGLIAAEKAPCPNCQGSPENAGIPCNSCGAVSTDLPGLYRVWIMGAGPWREFSMASLAGKLDPKRVGQRLLDQVEHTEVAFQADSLGDVFEVMNGVGPNWKDRIGRYRGRSMSVGDVAWTYDGKGWLCAPVGWEEIPGVRLEPGADIVTSTERVVNGKRRSREEDAFDVLTSASDLDGSRAKEMMRGVSEGTREESKEQEKQQTRGRGFSRGGGMSR